MASRFTETQRRAVQELLGLPSRLTADAVPAKLSVPIEDVRRALDLAEPPYSSLLAEDRWLAGGSVMRWLSGGLGKGTLHPGDVDLFFPSADALNETARSLIAAGYTFRCFRSFEVICQLCGGPGELVEPGGKDRGARIRCPSCGEFGGADAHTLTAGRLLRLTPELISRSGMLALEILSPRGEMFHLSALGIRPTLSGVLQGFDYSVIQFALDDRNLWFAPHAWTDLLTGRLRMVKRERAVVSYLRMRKYKHLGFRPYPTTFALAVYHALHWKMARILGRKPDLQRLAPQPEPSAQ